jgi:hypothetical protein
VSIATLFHGNVPQKHTYPSEQVGARPHAWQAGGMTKEDVVQHDLGSSGSMVDLWIVNCAAFALASEFLENRLRQSPTEIRELFQQRIGTPVLHKTPEAAEQTYAKIFLNDGQEFEAAGDLACKFIGGKLDVDKGTARRLFADWLASDLVSVLTGDLDEILALAKTRLGTTVVSTEHNSH